MIAGAKPKALSMTAKAPALRNKFAALHKPAERNYRLTLVPSERLK